MGMEYGRAENDVLSDLCNAYTKGTVSRKKVSCDHNQVRKTLQKRLWHIVLHKDSGFHGNVCKFQLKKNDVNLRFSST